MSNYCNTKHSIFVNNSIILKSTNQLLTDSPGPQLHCTSDLVTDTGSRLLIHFISLSISIENDTPDKYVNGIAILENILSVNLYDTKFSESDIFWYPSLLKYVSLTHLVCISTTLTLMDMRRWSHQPAAFLESMTSSLNELAWVSGTTFLQAIVSGWRMSALLRSHTWDLIFWLPLWKVCAVCLNKTLLVWRLYYISINVCILIMIMLIQVQHF